MDPRYQLGVSKHNEVNHYVLFPCILNRAKNQAVPERNQGFRPQSAGFPRSAARTRTRFCPFSPIIRLPAPHRFRVVDAGVTQTDAKSTHCTLSLGGVFVDARPVFPDAEPTRSDPLGRADRYRPFVPCRPGTSADFGRHRRTSAPSDSCRPTRSPRLAGLGPPGSAVAARRSAGNDRPGARIGPVCRICPGPVPTLSVGPVRHSSPPLRSAVSRHARAEGFLCAARGKRGKGREGTESSVIDGSFARVHAGWRSAGEGGRERGAGGVSRRSARTVFPAGDLRGEGLWNGEQPYEGPCYLPSLEAGAASGRP